MGTPFCQIFKSQCTPQGVNMRCLPVTVKPEPNRPGARDAPRSLPGAVVMQPVTSVLP